MFTAKRTRRYRGTTSSAAASSLMVEPGAMVVVSWCCVDGVKECGFRCGGAWNRSLAPTGALMEETALPLAGNRDAPLPYSARGMNRFVVPLLFGFGVLPLCSVFHECGHYVTALAFAAHPQLHWAFVSRSSELTSAVRFCIKAGGPFMDALCVAAGLCWLRRSRQREIPGMTQWFSFALVQRAIASILGVQMLISGSQVLPDEAAMSIVLGWSNWTLPCMLLLPWVAALVEALRAMPRGYRLIPFIAVNLGGIFGCGFVAGVLTADNAKKAKGWSSRLNPAAGLHANCECCERRGRDTCVGAGLGLMCG